LRIGLQWFVPDVFNLPTHYFHGAVLHEKLMVNLTVKKSPPFIETVFT